VVLVGAVLAAVFCFAIAFVIAHGVLFNSVTNADKVVPPRVWTAVPIDSVAARLAGVVLFVAIGLLVLLRTFIAPTDKPKRQSSRPVKSR
jgi:hypothetical protein